MRSFQRYDGHVEHPIPLTYSMNVHPSETLEEVVRAVERVASRVAAASGGTAEFPLGLRLGEPAVAELTASPGAFEEFARLLAGRRLVPLTLNAFPQSAFHGASVKTSVYRPDWGDPRRLAFTLRSAEILARLLPAGSPRGTVSTLPLGWDRGPGPPANQASAIENLLRAVDGLSDLEASSGRRVLLCLEPEPLCVLSSTADLIRTYNDRIARTAARRPPRHGVPGEERLRTYLGACLDVCHGAVLFEDPVQSLKELRRAGIPLGKLQASSALAIPGPDSRSLAESLRPLAEPRYLHQTVVRDCRGDIHAFPDIPDFLDAAPRLPAGAMEARCHFHVPVYERNPMGLASTRDELARTLRSASAMPPWIVEAETYTHSILPGAGGDDALAEALSRELRWIRMHLGP